ncbi:MAG: glycosyltransferase family 4 protein [Deltaproteobacteria bacterium]|nr:glycosyltransferase family 4 protein [Deltaproteobacteria bacterium]
MNILSPMATGNGAYIIYRILSNKIPNYHICDYNPYWTLCPPALPFLCRRQGIPDIIHTTPDYAAFFKRGKIPLVVTFHNLILDSFMERYSSLPQRIHYKTDLRFFTRKALSAATVVTAVSQFTAKLVKKELGYRGNVQVIYNGVDTNTFFTKQKKETVLIKVLFSGNLTRRKGVDLLPLIADKLNANIEILYTTGLRTKKKLPAHPNLKNIGAVPYSYMPKIYQDADILLFPTVREGFGLAAAEAMACGLPVVASNCSSIPELVNHGKGGFLCPVGDVEAFAEKINLLADSPKLRHEMGEYNRSKVEKMFTLDRMVNEYRELFEEVLS